jgi:hypothetical protein
LPLKVFAKTGLLLYNLRLSLFTAITNRRGFLSVCAASAGAFFAPWNGFADAPTPRLKNRMLDDLRFSTFSEQLHTVFRVVPEEGKPVELELIEANLPAQRNAAKARGMDAAYEKFSLIFSGPLADRLEQKIYQFEHPKIGSFEIFIVPIISKDLTKLHYQAVFNRPLK